MSDVPPLETLAPRPVARRDGGRTGALASLLVLFSFVLFLGVIWGGAEISAPPALLTVLVLFLPHLAVVFAAAVFALWVVFPDRRIPPFVLAGIIGCAAARWGPAWSTRPDATAGTPVVVMSWNVQRLWGEADGDPMACVVSAVEAAAPDVLALLEVSADDVSRLSVTLGLTCRHAPYTGSGDRVGGLAVCTRGAVWRLRSGEGQRFVDGEDWSYLFAEIEGPNRVFNLLAVHLVPYRVSERDLRRLAARMWEEKDPDPLLAIGDRGAEVGRAQSDQSAALLARVTRLRDPTVVAGDFNSTRDTALHVALRRTLTDAWERGGSGFGATIHLMGQIPLRVDHVYTSADFRVLGAAVPPARCSDHRPVVVQLALPDPG